MQTHTILQQNTQTPGPLWELGLNNWNNLITIQHHTKEYYTLHIPPTNVLMAILPNGDKTGPKPALQISLVTRRATLLLPATIEHRKLPNDTTPLLTTIRTSWMKFITPDNIPSHKPNSHANLMHTPTSNIISNKRPAMHIPETLPTPDASNPAPLHIMEITDHKTLFHKTIYQVNQLKTDHLTPTQLCQHIDRGFTLEHLARIHPEDEDTPIIDIPFRAT
jgi:hypothetical protein